MESDARVISRGQHPAENMIYERLVDGIIDKRLRPGEHLNEVKLARAYDAPRSRVRRVLERLREEGVVEIKLNQGAFVCRPTVEEARNVFEARMHLETAIVRLACQQAKPDDIKRLRTHLNIESESFAAGRADSNRVAGEFHTLIAEIAANPVLIRIVNVLIRRSCLIQSVYESKQGSLCLTDDHGQLVDHIEANRPHEAMAEMEHHFQHVITSLELTEERRKEADIYGLGDL